MALPAAPMCACERVSERASERVEPVPLGQAKGERWRRQREREREPAGGRWVGPRGLPCSESMPAKRNGAESAEEEPPMLCST